VPETMFGGRLGCDTSCFDSSKNQLNLEYMSGKTGPLNENQKYPVL